MAGARGLLINITGGDDMTLFEVDQAANRIREEVDEDANIIFGSSIDDALVGKVRVSVVATGIDTPRPVEQARPRLVAVGGGAPQPAVAAAGPPSANNAQHAPMYASPHPPVHAPAPIAATALRPSQPMAVDSVQEVVSESVAAAPRSANPLVRAAARSSGLFAEPSVQTAAEAPAAVAPGAEVMRPSLFETVTGVLLRRRAGFAPAPEPNTPRVEPVMQEQRPDTPAPTVRAVAGDEVGIEIPTFLRRQSS